TVEYKIEREDNKETLTATLNSADADYLLGVTMQGGGSVNKYTWSAPLVALGTTAQLTGETFKGLGKMLMNLITGAARQVSLDASTREQGREQIGEATSGVTGIVGMLGSIFPAFVGSASDIAFLAALISVSLACMNILPIPALDGGRWLLITIYKLRKKKLTKEKEEKIVTKAFLALLGLMVVITILDIIRLF
ncbi:site-2 protease family protein, partial [Candidatus Saccharibacteria bacterium]|nr:site-2 protease family protein [Candidatus Saccharibacteria bacterium]